MCTVTFIRQGRRVYFTSNRDEKIDRPPALLPDVYAGKTGKLIYPKDGLAGGTWAAMHENGRAMILLNGAAHAHKPSPPYRKSRGLVFLDVFDSVSPSDTFLSVSLNNIEPFTFIIWEDNNLWQAEWDGLCKKRQLLSSTENHIWSSSTLYDPQTRARRKEYFAEWFSQNQTPDAKAIEAFHASDHTDMHLPIALNDACLQTVSITQFSFSPQENCCHYIDRRQQKKHDIIWPNRL